MISTKHELEEDGDDSYMLSGVLGVFAASWNKASDSPKCTGNYLVVVRSYEPVIALYIEGKGWHLDDTIHAGLEDLVRYWMDMPKIPMGKDE